MTLILLHNIYLWQTFGAFVGHAEAISDEKSMNSFFDIFLFNPVFSKKSCLFIDGAREGEEEFSLILSKICQNVKILKIRQLINVCHMSL